MLLRSHIEGHSMTSYDLWRTVDTQQSTHQVRWFRQQVCLNCQYSCTRLHNIMLQKMVTFI